MGRGGSAHRGRRLARPGIPPTASPAKAARPPWFAAGPGPGGPRAPEPRARPARAAPGWRRPSHCRRRALVLLCRSHAPAGRAAAAAAAAPLSSPGYVPRAPWRLAPSSAPAPSPVFAPSLPPAGLARGRPISIRAARAPPPPRARRGPPGRCLRCLVRRSCRLERPRCFECSPPSLPIFCRRPPPATQPPGTRPAPRAPSAAAASPAPAAPPPRAAGPRALSACTECVCARAARWPAPRASLRSPLECRPDLESI